MFEAKIAAATRSRASREIAVSSELLQIKTRVTPELHARWKAKCENLKMSDSDALRLAMSQLMGGAFAPVRYAAIAKSQDKSRRRQEIRLTDSEIERISELARAFGASRRQYLVNLVRGHLLREPQLGMVELAVIGESNRQLAAFGRHFNQIAKKLNSGEDVEARAIAQALNRVKEEVDEHLAYVHGVMRSNLDRWPIADGNQ